jgi:hypothetical protein
MGSPELIKYTRPRKMPLTIEPLHPIYAADHACINMHNAAALRRQDFHEGKLALNLISSDKKGLLTCSSVAQL